MSAALVRQALDFVDPDESSDKRKNKKRGGAQKQSSAGQGSKLVEQKYKKSNKNKLKTKKILKAEKNKVTREAISKLLKLSKPVVDNKTTNKIVKRAVTGRPVTEKVKVKSTNQKSILFND